MDKRKSSKELCQKRQPSRPRTTQLSAQRVTIHPPAPRIAIHPPTPRIASHSPPLPPHSKKPQTRNGSVQTDSQTIAIDSPRNTLFCDKDIKAVASALQNMVNSLLGLDRKDVAVPVEVKLNLRTDRTVLIVKSASEERTVQLKRKSLLENDLKITADQNIKVFLGDTEIKQSDESNGEDIDEMTESLDTSEFLPQSQSIQTEPQAEKAFEPVNTQMVALAVDALHRICSTDSGLEKSLVSRCSTVKNESLCEKLKARVKCPAYTLKSNCEIPDESLERTSGVTRAKAQCDKSVFFKNPASTRETQTDNPILPSDDNYLHVLLDLKSKKKPTVLNSQIKAYKSLLEDSWQNLVRTAVEEIESPQPVKPSSLSPSKSELLTWTRLGVNMSNDKIRLPTKKVVFLDEPAELNLFDDTKSPDQPILGRVVWSLNPRSSEAVIQSEDEGLTMVAAEEEEYVDGIDDELVDTGMTFNAIWTDPYWK